MNYLKRINVRPWVITIMLSLFTNAAPAVAGDVVNGKKIYREHCQNCHGDNGRPFMSDTPDFSRGRGLLQPDTVLIESIRSGKTTMPAYRGILSDNDIFDVISYIRTFL